MNDRESKKAYLAPTEWDAPFQVYSCEFLGSVAGYGSDKFLLVKVDPPIEHKRPDKGVESFDEVLLWSRWEERPLFPIIKWPINVAVLLPFEPELRKYFHIGRTAKTTHGEYYGFGQGELCQTREEAQEYEDEE